MTAAGKLEGRVVVMDMASTYTIIGTLKQFDGQTIDAVIRLQGGARGSSRSCELRRVQYDPVESLPRRVQRLESPEAVVLLKAGTGDAVQFRVGPGQSNRLFARINSQNFAGTSERSCRQTERTGETE